MSSTIAADSRAFAARRTASGWGLSGGGVRADFRSGEPTLSLAGGNTLSLSLAGAPRAASVSAHGNRVTLARPGIREWYAAGPLGIEQGFTLAHRPAGATAHGVTLSLAVGGSLRAQAAGPNVNFLNARGGTAARYGGLTAVDATGRHLPSTLSVQRRARAHRVNDRGARYPLTIDPLVQQGPSSSRATQCRAARQRLRRRATPSPGTATPRSSAANIDNSEQRCGVGVHAVSGAWNQRAKIVPTNPRRRRQRVRQSVALSPDGTTALIGGELDNGPDSARRGSTSGPGSTYVEQSKLVGNGETGRRRVRSERRAVGQRQHGVDRRPGRPGRQPAGAGRRGCSRARARPGAPARRSRPTVGAHAQHQPLRHRGRAVGQWHHRAHRWPGRQGPGRERSGCTPAAARAGPSSSVSVAQR